MALKIYPEGSVVIINVPFTDHDNQQIVPATIIATLFDGEELQVAALEDIVFDSGSDSVDLTLEMNDLEPGQTSAARVLRVAITTDTGQVIKRRFPYLIELESRLVLMNNSFMSMETAELIARDMPHAAGWTAAGDTQRAAALIEAYNRLTRIPMRFRVADPLDELQRNSDLFAEETIVLRAAWPHVTAQAFLAWPLYFRKVLRTAQLTEANELLEGDTISKRSRAGIISERIGESEITLSGFNVDMGISKPALACLSGHIYYHNRIQRA